MKNEMLFDTSFKNDTHNSTVVFDSRNPAPFITEPEPLHPQGRSPSQSPEKEIAMPVKIHDYLREKTGLTNNLTMDGRGMSTDRSYANSHAVIDPLGELIQRTYSKNNNNNNNPEKNKNTNGYDQNT